MLSRFHLIPERYGRTDRFAISISRVSMLTRDKNHNAQFSVLYSLSPHLVQHGSNSAWNCRLLGQYSARCWLRGGKHYQKTMFVTIAKSASVDDTTISNGHPPSTAVDGSTTSQHIQTDNSGRFQTGFGCLRCPSWLPAVSGQRALVSFLHVHVSNLESMAVNGLLGTTISTIERRFALSSSQTAWIAVSYEVAGVPALLVIGYLGSTLRRPVWMSGGLIVLGVGFGIYSIPHFAAPPYTYVDSGDSSNLCIETTFKNASLTANNGCDVLILKYIHMLI